LALRAIILNPAVSYVWFKNNELKKDSKQAKTKTKAHQNLGRGNKAHVVLAVNNGQAQILCVVHIKYSNSL